MKGKKPSKCGQEWLSLFKVQFGADVPDWVINAWIRILKMHMPLLARRFKDIDGLRRNPYQMGLFLGYKLALTEQLNSDLPFPNKMNEEEKLRAQQLKEKHAKIMGRSFELICNTSLEEMQQCFEGVSKALKQGAFGVDGLPIGLTTRFRTLVTLLDHQEEVPKFRTIPELHNWMNQKLGQCCLDFKAFEKLCQEIGLRLPRRPRPALHE